MSTNNHITGSGRPATEDRDASPNVKAPAKPESVFVLLFLACCAVIAPIYTEAFPFSTCPMFAAHYDERREYRLFDRDGKQLRPEVYSLHANWNWYLVRFYGATYPESIVNPTYAPADMGVVVRHIQEVGTREGVAFPLKLVVTTWGPVDTRKVGVIARQEFTVEGPRKSDR